MPEVLPFKPFQYDPLLEEKRRAVILALGNDPLECRKISSCKGSSLRCRSIYCPSCRRGLAYKEKGRLLEAAAGIDSKRQWFATFKAKDVPLDKLREAGRTIMEAGRQALRSLPVRGFGLRLETSFEDWSDLYHVHAHAVVDAPSGGRSFISGVRWQDSWLEALPSELLPREGGSHVERIRSLEAVCTYANKSPFSKAESKGAVQRTVTLIQECKGLRGSANWGSLKFRKASFS